MLVCSCKNTNKYRNKEENSRKIRNIFYLITRRAGTHYMYQPFLIHYYIYTLILYTYYSSLSRQRELDAQTEVLRGRRITAARKQRGVGLTIVVETHGEQLA